MANLDFLKRVAIVTGAGRGMGRSHAIMLASRGAQVVVNDLPGLNGEESPADAVVREIQAAGGIAVANYSDVVDGANNIISTAVKSFGKLDVVVNNAGVVSYETLATDDPENWWRVFDVHFRGTVEVCRAAWPYLCASGTGRIISTSSSAMLGGLGLSSYGAAKGATFSLMRALALEGELYGIRCHAILPSAWTRITQSIKDPVILDSLQKHFQPEHVSALVTWLAHQDTVISNEAWQVSGGRAGRLVVAAYPTVRVAESTPESWAAIVDRLVASGKLDPLHSTIDMFVDELADTDPLIRDHALKAESGSLDVENM